MDCDLKNMDDCVKAAEGLIEYAANSFPNQFSFETGLGLTPLGIGYSQTDPLYYIGLTPA